MTQQAMASFLALNGNEIVNAARLKAYVDHGLTPNKYEVRCGGCDGLTGILPLMSSAAPDCGYQLPELDDAPWYDPNVPESKDFAGLLVTSATISAPYSRVTTPNIGDGQILGRQKLNGRTIVITAWLIGRTCCATSYGLTWLSDVLGDDPCAAGNCDGGGNLDFLSCCPEVCQDDGCLKVCTDESGECVEEVYVRTSALSEWQRGTDFFRTFLGTGVVDGPNVLDCQGTTCGCGCGSLLQVEFTLATSKPYAFHPADSIIKDMVIPACPEDPDCGVVWITDCSLAGCPDPTNCLDDPDCPFPALPPAPTAPLDQCACESIEVNDLVVPIGGERRWGSSVLNIDVSAGTDPMRNLRIYFFNNPDDLDCADVVANECDAFGALLVNFIPAGGTLHLNGETKRITVDCNGATRDAGRNVTDINGQVFAWPEIDCNDVCVLVRTDCFNTGTDATISIDRVDRDL